MKKNLLFMALGAMVALVACNKESGKDIRPVQKGDGTPVEVTVSINGAPGTKATDVTYANESKVNTLQVFVFNGEDLEAHRSVSNSLMALIPATAGERSVWAVVNAPDIYSVLETEGSPMTLSKLKAHTSALSDNTVDGFVMVGDVTQELVDGGKVPITVKRLVSRVSINKISASLKDYRESWEVQIDSIYMINVAADASLDLSAEPTVWANQLDHKDATYDGLLFDNLSIADPKIIVKNDVFEKEGSVIREHEAWVPEKMEMGEYELAEGVTRTVDNSYTKEHVFYAYPNSFSQSTEDSFSPRGSILVLAVTMKNYDGDSDGVEDELHGYYPIMLPVLERNKTYSIEEVKITRLPGEVPYKPIETGESQVVISVADWELGLNMGTVSI